MSVEMKYEEAVSKFGAVKFNGIELALTQQAFADNLGSGVGYYAQAIDEKGATYWVVWETTQAWADANDRHYAALIAGADPDCRDESNACDWSNPLSVALISEAIKMPKRTRAEDAISNELLNKIKELWVILRLGKYQIG